MKKTRNNSVAIKERKRVENKLDGIVSYLEKDVSKNIAIRERLVRIGARDKRVGAAIRAACAKDLLFFINYFGWTYDPRPSAVVRDLPFVTYPYQDEYLPEMNNAIDGEYDVLLDKSRDMGASWMAIALVVWRIVFKPRESFLFGSRKEAYVYCDGNMDALLQKAEYMLEKLPSFILGKNDYTVKNLQIRVHTTKSVIVGESANENFGTSGRHTAVFLDEFAKTKNGRNIRVSTSDVSRCRFFMGTPFGTGNEQYELTKTDIKHIQLMWMLHPEKRKGLYRVGADGELEILDKDYVFPPDYQFKLDDRYPFRSPWHDKEEARRTPFEMAQEVWCKYHGSGAEFFDVPTMNRIEKEYARPPDTEGELEYDPITCQPIRFTARRNGRLKLWFQVGANGHPVNTMVGALGVDVSAGTGASNSTAAFLDYAKKTVTLILADPQMKEEQHAAYCMAIAKWLNPSHPVTIIPDAGGGPGSTFIETLRQLRCGNVWSADPPKVSAGSKGKRRTKKEHALGFHFSGNNKYDLMSAFAGALTRGDIVIPSVETLKECMEYVFDKGTVIHQKSKNTEDPSGANANHGDRVIACALACKLFLEKSRNTTIKEPEPEPEPYSYLWFKRRDKEKDLTRGSEGLQWVN